MKRTAPLLIALSMFVVTTTTLAQSGSLQPQRRQGPPPGSTPVEMTTTENSTLSSAMKDLIILNLQKTVVSQNQAALQIQSDGIDADVASWKANFNTEVQKVKTAHKWGADVFFDSTTLGFIRMPTTPATKPNNPPPTPTTTPVAPAVVPAPIAIAKPEIPATSATAASAAPKK